MLDSREQTIWWEIHTVEGLTSYHLPGVRLRSKRRIPVADDASCDATFSKTCRSIYRLVHQTSKYGALQCLVNEFRVGQVGFGTDPFGPDVIVGP
jgi:hypothetical protein